MPARGKRARTKVAPAQQFALAAILAVQFGLAVALGWVLPLPPPDQAPDETAHRIYIQHLVDEHALPVFDAARGRDNPEYEFHQPPLYYALAAPVYAAAGGGDRGTRAVRLLSALIGLITTLAAFGIARTLWPEPPHLALGAAAVTAFWPMHLYTNASINNDGLAVALWATALWLLARYLRAPSLRGAALAGVVTGLALLTKTSTLILVPLGLIAITLAWSREKSVPWRHLFGDGGAFLGAAAVIGGWWLVRNQMLYGDALAYGVFKTAFGWQSPQRWFTARGFSEVTHWGAVAVLTHQSFWGAFGLGAQGVPAETFPKWLYNALSLLAAPSLVGAWLAVRAREVVARRIGLVLVAGWAFVFVAFLRFNIDLFQPQGRYLLPLVPILAVLLSRGWCTVGRGRAWALLPGGVLLACAVYALFLVERL